MTGFAGNDSARAPNPRKGPALDIDVRALYRGDTLYRIHRTNEPWKLGGGVSSGCIRMSNDDIIDLYARAKIAAPEVWQW